MNRETFDSWFSWLSVIPLGLPVEAPAVVFHSAAVPLFHNICDIQQFIDLKSVTKYFKTLKRIKRDMNKKRL